MSRSKSKSPESYRKIGDRFIHLIEDKLKLSLAEASRKLGYANPSTLYRIRDGKALPSHEKILMTAELIKLKRRKTVDLNWLFTGKRKPFFDDNEMLIKDEIDDNIIILLNKMSAAQRTALAALLGDD